MEKCKDIYESLSYLKQGEILTSDGKNQVVLKHKKICLYSSGTSFSLSIEDFTDLYRKTNFYLYEESSNIDETKDEAYYRYYKK